ncbi:MAG: hypothetical protein HC881_23975 [Leptolyngbyaceae cyanobacterium SL_7_1]|nr:hypothetical protein [Leptolyngbyaceae cyanobacterium SL_7_1]
MKSQSNGSTQNPSPTNAHSATPYSASVPISVYRELTAELQATKALLDSTNQQYQQLAQEHQRLRQEVERVVNQTLRLNQVLHPHAVTDPTQVDAIKVAEQLRSGYGGLDLPNPDGDRLANPTFTEQPSALLPEKSKSARDMGGIGLTLTVIVVVITAFTAGFIVFRPHATPQR